MSESGREERRGEDWREQRSRAPVAAVVVESQGSGAERRAIGNIRGEQREDRKGKERT